MALVYFQLMPEHALFRTAGGASPVRANGSTWPTYGIAFDATASENLFFRVIATKYGSGDLTLEVYWYADTSTTTTDGVVWEAAIAAVTPGDAQDMETDGIATAQTATGNPASTSQGLVKTTITISNLDGLADGDYLVLRLARLPANGSDTMAGDAVFVGAVLSYSDT